MSVQSIAVEDIRNSRHQISFDDVVDECPICHVKAHPHRRFAHLDEHPQKEGNRLWIIYVCPAGACEGVFISKFKLKNASNNQRYYQLESSFPQTITKEVFPSAIGEVSKAFSEIYNEARHAEQLGLTHICGPGYRKALKFLIKDYCIHVDSSRRENVIKLPLAKCIEDFVDSSRIKGVARRAAWLGNDETHYERVWTTKDVGDLKTLIRLTVNFIESEHLSEKYLSDMPGKTPVL